MAKASCVPSRFVGRHKSGLWVYLIACGHNSLWVAFGIVAFIRISGGLSAM